jgi:hypothetical protein
VDDPRLLPFSGGGEGNKPTIGVFSSKKNFKQSHRMFRYMHVALNVDKKITSYTDYDKFARQFF